MESPRYPGRTGGIRLYAVGIILFFLFSTVSVSMSAKQAPMIDGCPIFPANNAWNTPIDHLPLDANSSAYIATIGPTEGLHPDFGSGTWDGGPIGIPFNIVSGTQQKVAIAFGYAGESNPGPYPIPPDALIEGGSQSGGDRHVLVLDRDNCMLYETWSSYKQPDGSWHAGSGAIFDLQSNTLRPYGWTSADAAGLPVLPGLVRYDEVASGEIRHAIRFTAPQTRNTFVWPARHYASDRTGSNYPPMGQRFRLKAGFDISPYSPELQTIFRAMQRYGIILADNGSAWYISGMPDPRWDNDMLVSGFSQVRGSDFEAVDASGIMIQENSAEARQPSWPLTLQKSGNGSGTITSSPAGINCGDTCSNDFADGATVTLTAATAVGSAFNGWVGCDDSTGLICNVSMNSARDITADFTPCATLPVRSSGSYYSDLHHAYDLSSEGDLIQSQAVVIVESPVFSKDISVTMQGGYLCDYSGIAGISSISGTVTIAGGTIAMDGISIE